MPMKSIRTQLGRQGEGALSRAGKERGRRRGEMGGGSAGADSVRSLYHSPPLPHNTHTHTLYRFHHIRRLQRGLSVNFAFSSSEISSTCYNVTVMGRMSIQVQVRVYFFDRLMFNDFDIHSFFLNVQGLSSFIVSDATCVTTEQIKVASPWCCSF